MAEYELYCFAESGNAYKAALMLNLCGADWSARFVDYLNGETRSGEWRTEVSELGEIPVLLHGTRRLAQTGVILTYLSRQFEGFGPRSEDEEYEIQKWLLFDNHKFTSYAATLRFLLRFTDTQEGALTEFLRARAHAAFDLVEAHLAQRDYLLGDRCTIADISLCGYLYWPDELSLDWSRYPRITSWTGRVSRLPGWAHPYELMPRS